MIVITQMLMEKYNNYVNPKAKIKRIVNEGKLFPLTQGLYETDRHVSGYCLAGAIYGPSYLSFEFALSEYNLIPERVYTYTSATYDKKKIKEYENVFGRFSYHDVPADVYPLGVKLKEENGYYYHIASPEKALCDKLYIMPPVTSQKDIKDMLFDDLRIDQNEFKKLDFDSILLMGELYHCNNIKYLVKYIRRNRNE